MQVWPWSVLVPMMENDLRQRHAAAQKARGSARRRHRHTTPPSPAVWLRFGRAAAVACAVAGCASAACEAGLNPHPQAGGAPRGPAYDNALVMPLAEFARHPVVRDLLGDGSTMQVLVRGVD